MVAGTGSVRLETVVWEVSAMNLRIPAYTAALGAFVVLQPYRPYVVDGESMSPTFSSGQWLVGDSRPGRIERGDVVVFRYGSETMVKRVALLPGDRIERYRFLGEWKIPFNTVMRASMVRHHLPRHDLTVPTGRIYVLGDNFQESVDSRTYGTIPLRNVLAVVHGAAPTPEAWGVPEHLTPTPVALL